jgi:hypothetical protein
MVFVLNALGIAMMVIGVLILGGAKSAIHEIEAGLCLGLGAVVVALGVNAALLQKILIELRTGKTATSKVVAAECGIST